ncbi:hypothetical protein J4E91_006583 [Alternaria rosae]|nr:hypothetical protein J4E91_006583 [Alternaria rosae]
MFATLRVRQRVGVVLALLASLISCQNTTTNVTTASTFYLDRTETQFSINIADDSDDVFIYYASPAYSWVGVGFGEKMEGSLMFIMYPSSKSDNVTISTRIGSKASEPIFNSSVTLTILPGTRVDDDMLILRARCGNCRSFIDTEATAHPMIYAFGHGQNLQSNSPSANLKRHIRYGHFTMDMATATGPGGVPAKSNALNGVSMLGDMTRDHDRANLAHAVIGCLALFLLWPLNVLLVGFFKNIKIHVVFSILIMIFLLVSYVLGGVTSAQYNRSKAFNTPHQIIAFISLLPLLLTSVLPSLKPYLPRLQKALHTPLASTSLVLLILTGGLGLHLSGQTRPIVLIYTAISIAVFLFIFIIQSCIRKRGSAYSRAERRQNRGLGEDNDEMVMLGKMEENGMPYGHAAEQSGSREFGSDGQRQQQHVRSQSRTHYGGGTMPGPQYLLNMHPGVPVQVSRM